MWNKHETLCEKKTMWIWLNWDFYWVSSILVVSYFKLITDYTFRNTFRAWICLYKTKYRMWWGSFILLVCSAAPIRGCQSGSSYICMFDLVQVFSSDTTLLIYLCLGLAPRPHGHAHPLHHHVTLRKSFIDYTFLFRILLFTLQMYFKPYFSNLNNIRWTFCMLHTERQHIHVALCLFVCCMLVS